MFRIWNQKNTCLSYFLLVKMCFVCKIPHTQTCSCAFRLSTVFVPIIAHAPITTHQCHFQFKICGTIKVGVNPSLKREMWLIMHLITKKTCTKMYKSIHFWNQKSQMNPMVATDFCKIMQFSRKSSVTMVTMEFFLDSITKIWFY